MSSERFDISLICSLFFGSGIFPLDDKLLRLGAGLTEQSFEYEVTEPHESEQDTAEDLNDVPDAPPDHSDPINEPSNDEDPLGKEPQAGCSHNQMTDLSLWLLGLAAVLGIRRKKIKSL